MPYVPPQTQYSTNLNGTSMGVALYEPKPFRPEIFECRVGDVAYFDSESGDYKWICNAFDTSVLAHVSQVLTLAFEQLELASISAYGK